MKKSDTSTNSGGSGATTSQRRASFESKQTAAAGPGPRAWLFLIPLLIAVAVGAAFLTSRSGPSTAAAQVTAPDGYGYPVGINSQAPNKKYPVIRPDASGEFRIPASAFADGKARFFTTSLSSGKDINFFVVRSSDGVIRAAIDSCDVCYAARKGYHQEGDYMVCNNCGQRFATTKINDVKGGCNPSPLTRAMQGDSVVIKLSDLEKENRAENGQPLF